MKRCSRICVVGSFPHVPQALPTQGEMLANSLRSSGFEVDLISTRPSKLGRLAHIVSRTLFNGWRYDAVCIQVFGNRAVLLEGVAISLTRLWRKRLVLVMRGGNLPKYLQSSSMALFMYKHADCIVCPSAYLAESIKKKGLACEQIIPNIIPIEFYSFRKRTVIAPKLLWLRGFHPVYNPLMALRSFVKIRRRYPSASLTMASADRDYQQYVKQSALRMGLPDVRFPGMIPKTDIPALMAEHDVYINTPHIDNTPVTVIEAMACGLPVVSTNVRGMPHLLTHGQTGLLVDDDDAVGMGQAIVRLVDSPALVSQLSQNGRDLAETFTWACVKEKWVRILTKAS